MMSTPRIERFHLCRSLFLAAVALVAAVDVISGVNGFVNVPQVRKAMLHATSTSVTYEPAFAQLTDAFSRNPFTDGDGNEEEAFFDKQLSSQGAVASMRSSSLSSLPADNNMLTGSNSKGAAALWWWLRKYLQSERARRSVQANARVALHHFFRDSGALRGIMDFLVTLGTPSLVLDHPDILPRFLQLTKDCIRIPYGSHALQGIDMYMPPKEEKPRGLLFFVHGGAWGSGLPWMYRLVAQPFLDKGMAVAIVGYRTFPDGDIADQVSDLEMAAQQLARQYPNICQKESEFGVVAMGHSSGAHLLMQVLVNRIQRQLLVEPNTSTTTGDSMRMDSFVGMSAPYEIASHYEFETLRGLQELSPMKAACGNDKETLSNYSPVLQLCKKLVKRSDHERQLVNNLCPRIAMIHGVQDDTVPFTATRQAAKLLNLSGITKCDEMYLSETGHSETVFELMFGGSTQNAVMGWLDKIKAPQP